jgi:hypothetical protein
MGWIDDRAARDRRFGRGTGRRLRHRARGSLMRVYRHFEDLWAMSGSQIAARDVTDLTETLQVDRVA